MQIKVAEFCAGVGGFRLGIALSNMDASIVYANEIDTNCEKTYTKNFGKGFDSRNIFDVDESTLPDFDMICAGFPCQPFSVAGKELGFDDPRGTIFFKLLQIIRVKRPQIVFLENVTNLVHHDRGQTYKTIIKSLEKAGYHMSPVILDSSLFGVPQSRSRIYIIGLLESVYGNREIHYKKKITERTSLRPFLISGDYSIPISKKWNDYIDLYTGKKNESELGFDVPRTRKSLEKIAHDCDVSDCILQVRSSGVRALSLDEPFPTFTVLNSGGGAHIPILTKERRHVSIAEIKRIMGFPDWYDFSSVSRTDAAKQLANAVCPPVIASICNDIMVAISQAPLIKGE